MRIQPFCLSSADDIPTATQMSIVNQPYANNSKEKLWPQEAQKAQILRKTICAFCAFVWLCKRSPLLTCRPASHMTRYS